MNMWKQMSFGACALVLLGLAAPIHAQQLWSGVLESPRAVNWSNVGSPAVAFSTHWTQCSSTVAAGSSAATINAAIAACGANHYVQLAAGTYTLTSTLTFGQKSNVKLVGMGANQTFLVFTGTTGCWFGADICMDSADLNDTQSPSNLANWTAGYSQGATSITLSALVSGSKAPTVGISLILDQLDDSTDDGNINVCYEPNTEAHPCSTNGDNGGFARTNRGQMQIVTVTSVSGKGPYTVGISPGLQMPNWNGCNASGGCAPQAWWATSPIQNMGIENMSMNFSASEPSQGNGVGVEILNCSGCWLKGVAGIAPGRSDVFPVLSTYITVQDSYFFKTAGHTSVSYGVESDGTSAMLVQNNIFQQVTEPMSFNGSCSGCVEAYNFDVGSIYGISPWNWRMASVLPHAVGNAHILMEGNQGSGLVGDIVHGSHHFLTAFRNTWNGYQPNNGVAPRSNIGPVILMAQNRFFNIVGNVLGTPAITYGYTTGTNQIYPSIGGSESNAYTVPADSNVARTLMRWGNYDTATGAVRWCGNSSDPGWSTTCASTSEVPSTIPQYANPVPSSTSLPASFYLSARPAWWPSSKAWPPIGPDVSGGNLGTCSGGTYAGLWATRSAQCTGGTLAIAYAGHANSIPAMDCYLNTMGGSLQGTGSVLTFDAAACYYTHQTKQSVAPPTSPTAVPVVP